MEEDRRCYLLEYWDLIQRREVIAGYWIKAQIRRLVEDLEDPAYIYDTTEAHRRFRFEQNLCFQSKAPYYGQPLVLMPWQLGEWEAVYSFRMADSGKRRFNNVLWEIARKNGKSTMIAGDSEFDLFLGEPGADICCASNDDRQAKLIWSEIGEMRQKLDPHKAMTMQNLTMIRNFKKNVSVFRLSSKTQNKDGFNISKTVLDESHDIAEENGQSEVAEACWRGMSSRDEPLFINCTTQGFNRDCYLDRRISYMKKVISGEIDDIHSVAFLYEQDSETEVWQDEKSWEKANPSLRYGVKKIDKLRQDVEEAKHDRAKHIHLLTKDFNLPRSSAQGWLMLEDFAYPTGAVDADAFKGSLVLGSVDLSATTDLSSAKILVMRPGDAKKYIFSHYWIPEGKLDASDDREAGAKYADWARDGLLSICEGNEIAHEAVADWFYEMFVKYGFRPFMIGYDQRFAKVFIDRCSQYGFETEMLAQGRALSNAMKLVEADLKSRLIVYGENEMDKWCLGNCCCAVDNYGNIQPVKVPGQHSRRIDGALTFIMAYETYRRHKADYLTAIGGGTATDGVA